jgi:hypothetical protein
MPFDPSSDDAWQSYRGPLWNGPGGGRPYPNDWTDPFINLRASGPAVNAPAPFSAAQLGAMAWHPPIFPGDWLAPVPNNFPAGTWPQQSNPPAAPTSAHDLTTAPGWPFLQSILAPLAQPASPAAPRSIDSPRGLFSRDPSIPVGGLFGGDPDPTSPFAGGPFGAGGDAASAPLPGVPRAPSTLGLPAPPSLFPPFAQLQSPFAAAGTDPSSAPGWPYPQSIIAPLAQLASPAAARSLDSPRGLFSRDPSIPLGGLFGWDPDPTSPFAGGPFGAGGDAAAAPLPGVPRAPSTLGLPAPQSPALAGFPI